MINDLICDKEKNRLKWIYDGLQVTACIPDLDLAMLDERREMVFVLSKSSPLPTLLTILDMKGASVATFSPPEGSYFYYFELNNVKEVLVVCSFSEEINGWYDWHYSLDLENKNLIREAPSY